MRKHVTVLLLILCLMSGTVTTGCGQTMQLKVAMDLYEIGMSLIYQAFLNAVNTSDQSPAATDPNGVT